MPSVRLNIYIALIAGAGGMLPTLCRVGATYANNPDAPMPDPGLYLGLLIFFVIGAVLAIAFGEKSTRQALMIGISAPALITGISNGTEEGGAVSPPAESSPTGAPQLVDPETALGTNGETSWRLFWPGTALAQDIGRETISAEPATARRPEPPARRTAAAIERVELFGTRRVTVEFDITGTKANGPAINTAIQFFDEGGYRVGETASVPSKGGGRIAVVAPVSARGFIVYVGNAKRTVLLPKQAFDLARYSVSGSRPRLPDLLWALGFKRDDTRIDDLRAERGEVKLAPPVADVIRQSSEGRVFGIDISKFQSGLSWSELSDAQIRFVVMRATYGVKPDDKVEEFWDLYQGFSNRDRMTVGFYHFFRFGQNPAEQAQMFLDVIDGKSAAMSLPPTIILATNIYDDPIETETEIGAYLDAVQAFIGVVEAETGMPVMVFANQQILAILSLPNELLERPLWIKDFIGRTPNLPPGASGYDLWQIGTAAIPGVDGVVDLNVFNGAPADFERLVRRGG